jgi:hypothetical protein
MQHSFQKCSLSSSHVLASHQGTDDLAARNELPKSRMALLIAFIALVFLTKTASFLTL